ncbi:hypothetical protein B0H17DRAFT_1134833 [Mycena rosella]|uniref:Uncharacterized protein n=1 Tax=Mycena rosella TaxID=1033263 RepID=A0AAD7DED9_MYCRO|nr:hypothetical protein B0H17DRAFT_1134833 [Mycena rosella]
MRTVRGRKGGSGDGMMDGREAVPFSTAEKPGGQGDVRTEYRPAGWCAGGHVLFSSQAWAGESTIGCTRLDGIFTVSTMVQDGVIIGMLPNHQEDRENMGRRHGIADCPGLAKALVMRGALYEVLSMVARGRRGPFTAAIPKTW